MPSSTRHSDKSNLNFAVQTSPLAYQSWLRKFCNDAIPPQAFLFLRVWKTLQTPWAKPAFLQTY